MTLTAGQTGPYAPPAGVIEFMRRYRDRGLPVPITTEVLERAGIPETLSQRTLHSLRLLNLVDSEGNPTPEFEEASRAPDAEYKQRLGELLTDVYGEIITLADPATDSYDRVRDAFRGLNPRGQQERMVTLFLGLLDYAGLDTSAASASRKREPAKAGNGAARPTTVRKTAAKKVAAGDKSRNADSEHNHNMDDLPAGLVGLLRQIPRGGAGWPSSRRDEFMKAFGAVLDFSVPVRDSEPSEDEPEEEDET